MSKELISKDTFTATLRGRLRAVQQSGEEHHPEADQFAALAGNGMSDTDRFALMAHLSVCVSCRELAFLTSEPLRAPASPSMQWAALIAASAVASLVFFSPDLLRKDQHPEVVAGAGKQIPARIFIPPPVRMEPKRSAVLAATPPLLLPAEKPATPALPVFIAAEITPPARQIVTVQNSFPNSLIRTALDPARDARVEMLKLSAPSWSIGANGKTLKHLVRETHKWESIAIPGLTGSIRTVSETSPSEVHIETTTGERWLTSDSGLHWTKTL